MLLLRVLHFDVTKQLQISFKMTFISQTSLLTQLNVTEMNSINIIS